MSNWPTYQAPPQIDLPPWGWNPAATFLTAYNTMAKERRAQEEFAMQAELNKILFPVKKAQAEFNLKQLAYETENLAGQYKMMGEEYDARRRFLRSGSGSNAAGSAGSSNPQQVTDPRNPLFYFQPRNTTPAPAPTPTTSQPAPTGKKVKLVF